ncbi:MAG: aldo/keto reductase [bacterium]|nr:aldo/keto reductase [bacterium]
MNSIPVGLGTASFGTSISQENSYRVLDKYASLGGRIIDTANNYAYWHPQAKGGESETVIGAWLERVDRAAFTIMTKIGSQPLVVKEGVNNLEGLSPQAVQSAVSKSLDRLKTDYIDILLAHHDDRSTPLKDTWEAFSELVASDNFKWKRRASGS